MSEYEPNLLFLWNALTLLCVPKCVLVLYHLSATETSREHLNWGAVVGTKGENPEHKNSMQKPLYQLGKGTVGGSSRVFLWIQQNCYS